MKTSVLITAMALAFGGATMAQAAQDTTRQDTTRSEQASQDTKADASKGESLGTKTKRAFHRMGDKIRSAMHRDKSDEHHTAKDEHASDTRAMGAGAARSDDDHDRRARMDGAYNNWQHKQKQ